MRPLILLTGILLIACHREKANQGNHIQNQPAVPDTVLNQMPQPSKPARYSNDRFREVAVEKVAQDRFRVRGQGQIFEASFGWVVEDGHNELEKGFQTTDAGAPQWGNFDFAIDVRKVRANSTLTLILFETSAKDGSRQHELAIALW